MKYIKRVSKVKNDDTKGYIINSTNVTDKEKNTYSAGIIDGLVSDDYSTTEQVIGTYNNKPLYRKTVVTTKANLITELNKIKNKSVIKFDGFMFANNGAKMPLFTSFSATGYNWTLYTDNGGNVNGEFGSNFGDTVATEVTIYYTKTTD